MSDKKVYSGRLRGEISAIVSGILTNLIYEELAVTKFKIVSTEGECFVIQLNDGAFGIRLAVIMGTFIVLWLLISLVIPICVNQIERLRYKNIKGFNKKSVVTVFHTMKKNVQEISEQIRNLSETNRLHVLPLYTCELGQIINRMHDTFCPRTRHLKRIVQASFRNGATVYDMGRYISSYEFDTLLNEIQRLLEEVSKSSRSKLLQADCEMLKEQLSIIKNVVLSQ